MKRKLIFFVTLLTIFSLLTIQSCKKESPVKPTNYIAAMPDVPSPVADGVVPFTGTGQAINLTWTGAATNAISWDVYFGTKSSPALAASGVTSNAYTATVNKGGTYYWQVVTTDANNVESDSPVWSFEVNSNPNVPGTPVPALNALKVSCNPTIRWSATDPEGDALTYDLYLGTTATPPPYSTGLADTSLAITATLKPNTIYYWSVVAHDPFGGVSTSPVWKFTTGALPVATYVGAYTADEPAETYSYDVNFTQVDASTIKCDNYWNSAWVVNFKLDFTNLTYSFATVTFAPYSMNESGIIDPATGQMVGSYTIFKNGVSIEQGVHTYTKH